MSLRTVDDFEYFFKQNTYVGVTTNVDVTTKDKSAQTNTVTLHYENGKYYILCNENDLIQFNVMVDNRYAGFGYSIDTTPLETDENFKPLIIQYQKYAVGKAKERKKGSCRVFQNSNKYIGVTDVLNLHATDQKGRGKVRVTVWDVMSCDSIFDTEEPAKSLARSLPIEDEDAGAIYESDEGDETFTSKFIHNVKEDRRLENIRTIEFEIRIKEPAGDAKLEPTS